MAVFLHSPLFHTKQNPGEEPMLETMSRIEPKQKGGDVTSKLKIASGLCEKHLRSEPYQIGPLSRERAFL